MMILHSDNRLVGLEGVKRWACQRAKVVEDGLHKVGSQGYRFVMVGSPTIGRAIFVTGTRQVTQVFNGSGTLSRYRLRLTELVCSVSEESGVDSVWTCSFPELCL